MTGFIKVTLAAAASMAVPAMAHAQSTGHPIVLAALAGPGPQANTNANTGSFNFSTPNGSVDLNRPGGAVLATPPGQPPVFFIAPPGTIQDIGSMGIDAILDASAGILD